MPGMPSAAALSLHLQKITFVSVGCWEHSQFQHMANRGVEETCNFGVDFHLRRLCHVVARQLAAAVGE